MTSFSNGNAVRLGGFTADSMCYYMNATHGNVFEGLDIGGSPIGIYLDNVSDAVIVGGQYETFSTAVFHLATDCEITVMQGYSQGTAGGVLLRAGSSTGATFINHRYTAFTTDSLMYLSSTTSAVRWIGSEYGTPPVAHLNVSGGIKIPLSEWHGIRNFYGASVPRNRIYNFYRAAEDDSTIYGPDHLVFGQEIYKGKIFNNYLTDGSDWRYDSNGKDSTHAARVNRIRYYYGVASGTTGAGDSTVVSVWTDTSGVDAFYYMNASVDRTSPDATPMDAHISQLSATASTGEVKFLIWHKSDTGGSINYRINYFIIAKAKVLGKW